MDNIVNREKSEWVRPWNLTKFDDLYNRDERFFSILTKGLIGWLNENIIMYNKPINHFIYNTGSSYMYVESNGYEFSWTETTGEDYMYMQMPRCILEINDISTPLDELTSPFARGDYERHDKDMIRGYNAEIRRMPIDMSVSMHYVLSNFNESIVVLQEIIDKLAFQRYFNIVYLGQVIRCSIEFPESHKIELNKIDMTSTETNQRNIDLEIKVCTSYPVINERTEILSTNIIAYWGGYSRLDSDTIDFSYLDVNGDGKVDQHDIDAIIDYILNAIDYNPMYDFNNDGVLDKRDVDKFMEIIAKLSKYDFNNDLKINHWEINIIQNIINYGINDRKYDFNGDGKVDMADVEILARLIANEVFDKRWSEIDLEFAKQARDNGDKDSEYDVNGNGKVDDEDINIIKKIVDNSEDDDDDYDPDKLDDAVKRGYGYNDDYDTDDDGDIDDDEKNDVEEVIDELKEIPALSYNRLYNTITIHNRDGVNGDTTSILDVHKYIIKDNTAE